MEEKEKIEHRDVNNAYVIGVRETVRGFHLIGIPGKIVNNAEEAKCELEKVIKEKYSLIVISATVAEEIAELIEALRKEFPIPIIVISDLNTKVDMSLLEKSFKTFFGK